MASRMIFHFLPLLFSLHLTICGYPLICPSKPHWNFRAKHFCQNVDDYRCLWDKNNKRFIEQCEGYDIQMKGFRKVIEGDITAGECTENRYQPRMWTTKGNFDCVLEKSPCNEIGQVVYDDGDGVTDRTCGCNYKAGYIFLQKPKNLCYCEPTVEDCTCIKKKCPPEHVVDPVTEKAFSNKNNAVIVVAFGLVIFIFIGFGVIAFYVGKTDSGVDTKKKMEIHEQNKFKDSKAREELEIHLEEKERQHQEEKLRKIKANEELKIHLKKIELQHQEEKLIESMVRESLQRNLKEKERQHQEQKEEIADLQKMIAMKDHKWTYIKNVGESNSAVSSSQIGFKLVKQYTLPMRRIHDIAVSPDGSLWIGDFLSEKVQHIKLTGDSTTTMSTFNVKPYGMGILPSGSPLILKGGSSVQIINELTRQIVDSKYSIKPWILSCLHITTDNNVIAGGIGVDKGVVIVIDKNGKHISEFEKDNDKQLLFYPTRIAKTRNGYIFVIDELPSARSRRLAVFKPGSHDVIYYTGNDDITTDDKPFKPVSILVTPNDNVLLVNFNTSYLYIMNNEGDFITCFDLSNIGISQYPFSLALSPTGNIYIGNVNEKSAPKEAKSTLYELEYTGV